MVHVSICVVAMGLEFCSKPLEFFNTLVENALISTTSRLQISHPLVELSDSLSERRNLVLKRILSASHHLEVVHRWEMQLIDEVFDLLNFSFKFFNVLLVVIDLIR